MPIERLVEEARIGKRKSPGHAVFCVPVLRAKDQTGDRSGRFEDSRNGGVSPAWIASRNGETSEYYIWQPFIQNWQDSYYNYPSTNVQAGQWFDMIWSIVLVIPLLVAATWNRAEASTAGTPTRGHSIVLKQFFPVLYPFLTMLMLGEFARDYPILAFAILLLGFACFSVRMLIIQHRQQEAVAQIKTLIGMLPICASCKKIRDDKGYWNTIETYIRDHSEADFSHSICPGCMRKLYPQFVDETML